MNIFWAAIGILALIGFAVLVVLLFYGTWKDYQFSKMLRVHFEMSGHLPVAFTIEPRWLRKIAMTHYMMTKQYEHEDDQRLREAGRRMRRLGSSSLEY